MPPGNQLSYEESLWVPPKILDPFSSNFYTCITVNRPGHQHIQLHCTNTIVVHHSGRMVVCLRTSPHKTKPGIAEGFRPALILDEAPNGQARAAHPPVWEYCSSKWCCCPSSISQTKHLYKMVEKVYVTYNQVGNISTAVIVTSPSNNPTVPLTAQLGSQAMSGVCRSHSRRFSTQPHDRYRRRRLRPCADPAVHHSIFGRMTTLLTAR